MEQKKSETNLKEGPSEKLPVPGDQAKTDTNMLRSALIVLYVC